MTTQIDMSEKAFMAAILDLAERLGWKSAHFHSTMRRVRRADGSYGHVGDKAAAGFPDLVLVKSARLIFAELKREKTQMTHEQEDWLEALGQVQRYASMRWDTAPETYLWRPRMWPEIEAVLKGVAPGESA